MSVSRPFKWHCDRCGVDEFKDGYGFPTGWNWLKPNNPSEPITHICPDCKKPGDRIGGK